MKLDKIVVAYLTFVIIIAITSFVAIYSGDSESAVTPGTPRHNHSSATTGGSTITNTTASQFFIESPVSIVSSSGVQSSSIQTATTGASGSLWSYFDSVTGNTNRINLKTSSTDTDNAFNFWHLSSTSAYIGLGTVDGADDTQLTICPTDSCANNRGASISLYGNENGSPGYNIIRAGSAAGIIQLITESATVQQAANGSLTTTKSCAAGYTRRNINYCEKDDHSAAVLPVRDTCTNHTIPAEAKLMHLHMEVFTRSNNAIAARNTSLVIYHDAGCVTGHNAGLSSAYEHTAVAAATLLATDSNEVFFPANGSALYRSKLTDDAGNQGNAEIYELGYYD